jgi:hypothetical protein
VVIESSSDDEILYDAPEEKYEPPQLVRQRTYIPNANGWEYHSDNFKNYLIYFFSLFYTHKYKWWMLRFMKWMIAEKN